MTAHLMLIKIEDIEVGWRLRSVNERQVAALVDHERVAEILGGAT